MRNWFFSGYESIQKRHAIEKVPVKIVLIAVADFVYNRTGGSFEPPVLFGFISFHDPGVCLRFVLRPFDNRSSHNRVAPVWGSRICILPVEALPF